MLHGWHHHKGHQTSCCAHVALLQRVCVQELLKMDCVREALRFTAMAGTTTKATSSYIHVMDNDTTDILVDNMHQVCVRI